MVGGDGRWGVKKSEWWVGSGEVRMVGEDGRWGVKRSEWWVGSGEVRMVGGESPEQRKEGE